MSCKICTAYTKTNTRCKRKASCVIGCSNKCWQHAARYKGPGAGCGDVYTKGFRFGKDVYTFKMTKVSPRTDKVRFTIECNREPVAHDIALSHSPESGVAVVDIERFYVQSRSRRVGHGTSIMRALGKWYKKGGTTTFKVESPTGIGRTFYRKVGFMMSRVSQSLELSL